MTTTTMPRQLPTELGDERTYVYNVRLDSVESLVSDDPNDPILRSARLQEVALAELFIQKLELLAGLEWADDVKDALLNAILEWQMLTITLVEDGV